MKVLVLGASGATGRLVVKRLLEREVETRIVVRNISGISENHQRNPLLEIIVGNISEFDSDQYSTLTADCDAVVSCLGHNITLKGVFGKPRRLVLNCIENICNAIMANKNGKIKLILMSTTAFRNQGMKEKYDIRDRMVLSVLYHLLPPQKDNVEAGLYLLNTIGMGNDQIEWVMVRPDTLIDEGWVSEYEIHQSPKRSPVFDSGETSRINVSAFMVKLLIDNKLWNEWKFRLPVLYNSVTRVKKN